MHKPCGGKKLSYSHASEVYVGDFFFHEVLDMKTLRHARVWNQVALLGAREVYCSAWWR